MRKADDITQSSARALVGGGGGETPTVLIFLSFILYFIST